MAKGYADHILISGDTGGTGASPLTSIKHAGLPWELGIAETHQTLVLNDLRSRVVLQTDGRLKTGRDVVIAAHARRRGVRLRHRAADHARLHHDAQVPSQHLPGRHRHAGPGAAARSSPASRSTSINYLFMVAEEARQIMAELGFRTINEMVGRVDLLETNARDQALEGRRPRPDADCSRPRKSRTPTSRSIARGSRTTAWTLALDNELIDAGAAGDRAAQAGPQSSCRSSTRTAPSARCSATRSPSGGATSCCPTTRSTSSSPARPARASARSSPRASRSSSKGDANDYVGKGLSGGRIIIYPPTESTFEAEDNIIIGNVALYGATSGEAFFRGRAAERFCVRNSGANAVIEGVGDHGCEYMTGGRVGDPRPHRPQLRGRHDGRHRVRLGPERATSPSNCNTGHGRARSGRRRRGHQRAARADRAAPANTPARPSPAQILDEWPKSITAVRQSHADRLQARARRTQAARRGSRADAARRDRHVRHPSGPLRAGRFAAWVSPPALRVSEARAVPYRDPRANGPPTSARSSRSPPMSICAIRALAAWTAACRSARATRGCPIDNLIPEWNDLVYQGRWRDALDRLHKTNNFPEFTGRTCPAPCEGACVLGITDPAGHDQEHRERDHRPRLRRRLGQARSRPPDAHGQEGRGRRLGPCGPRRRGPAQQGRPQRHGLRAGRPHRRPADVRHSEHEARQAGREPARRSAARRRRRVRHQRRRRQESSIAAEAARRERRAAARDRRDQPTRSADSPAASSTACTSRWSSSPRTRRACSTAISRTACSSTPRASDVIVIGGGDTGADCIGTALRHGCKSLVNFELLDQPPAKRAADNPWPTWPRILRTDYAHEESIAQLRRRSAQIRGRDQGDSSANGHGNVAGVKHRADRVAEDGRRRAEAGRARRHAEKLDRRSGAAGDGLPGPRAYVARNARRRARRRVRNYKA